MCKQNGDLSTYLHLDDLLTSLLWITILDKV